MVESTLSSAQQQILAAHVQDFPTGGVSIGGQTFYSPNQLEATQNNLRDIDQRNQIRASGQDQNGVDTRTTSNPSGQLFSSTQDRLTYGSGNAPTASIHYSQPNSLTGGGIVNSTGTAAGDVLRADRPNTPGVYQTLQGQLPAGTQVTITEGPKGNTAGEYIKQLSRGPFTPGRIIDTRPYGVDLPFINQNKQINKSESQLLKNGYDGRNNDNDVDSGGNNVLGINGDKSGNQRGQGSSIGYDTLNRIYHYVDIPGQTKNPGEKIIQSAIKQQQERQQWINDFFGPSTPAPISPQYYTLKDISNTLKGGVRFIPNTLSGAIAGGEELFGEVVARGYNAITGNPGKNIERNKVFVGVAPVVVSTIGTGFSDQLGTNEGRGEIIGGIVAGRLLEGPKASPFNGKVEGNIDILGFGRQEYTGVGQEVNAPTKVPTVTVTKYQEGLNGLRGFFQNADVKIVELSNGDRYVTRQFGGTPEAPKVRFLSILKRGPEGYTVNDAGIPLEEVRVFKNGKLTNTYSQAAENFGKVSINPTYDALGGSTKTEDIVLGRNGGKATGQVGGIVPVLKSQESIDLVGIKPVSETTTVQYRTATNPTYDFFKTTEINKNPPTQEELVRFISEGKLIKRLDVPQRYTNQFLGSGTEESVLLQQAGKEQLFGFNSPSGKQNLIGNIRIGSEARAISYTDRAPYEIRATNLKSTYTETPSGVAKDVLIGNSEPLLGGTTKVTLKVAENAPQNEFVQSINKDITTTEAVLGIDKNILTKNTDVFSGIVEKPLIETSGQKTVNIAGRLELVKPQTNVIDFFKAAKTSAGRIMNRITPYVKNPEEVFLTPYREGTKIVPEVKNVPKPYGDYEAIKALPETKASNALRNFDENLKAEELRQQEQALKNLVGNQKENAANILGKQVSEGRTAEVGKINAGTNQEFNFNIPAGTKKASVRSPILFSDINQSVSDMSSTDTLIGTSSNTGTSSNVGTTSGTKDFISPTNDISIISNTSQNNASEIITSPSQISSPTQIISPSQISTPSTITTPSQVTSPSQITNPTQITNTEIQYLNRSQTGQDTIIPRVPKPTENILEPPTTRRSSKKSYPGSGGRRVQAYDVLLKRRGSFDVIGRGLTRNEALLKGERAALGDLAATFKLVRDGSTSDRGTQRPSDLDKYFRDYKIVKGKPIKLVDTYIQKRGLRLVTSQERGQLQAARQRASKRGGFSWI